MIYNITIYLTLHYFTTIMTTITALLDIVINNDYIRLEEIINNTNANDFSIFCGKKNGYTLLLRAVERRSLECFDLLINIPNYQLFNMCNNDSGLTMVIDYYVNAPNMKNLYYVNAYIDKIKNIEIYNLTKLINYTDLFDQFFNKLECNKANISSLLRSISKKNNIMALSKIYNYITANPELANSDLKESMIQDAIDDNNLDIIIFLIEEKKLHINITFKIYFLDKVVQCPILYYLNNRIQNKTIFQYFLNKFKKLSNEQLNNIENINNFALLVQNVKNVKSNHEQIMQILSLNINFSDSSKYIVIHFNEIIQKHLQYYNYYGMTNIFDEKLMNIFYLLKYNTVKTNPYLYFQEFQKFLPTSKYNTIYENMMNPPHYSTISYISCRDKLILFIKDVCYLLSAYNFEMPLNIKADLMRFFTEEQKQEEIYIKDVKKCLERYEGILQKKI